MRTIIKTAVTLLVMGTAAFSLPSVAAADSAICHNGVLSDDAGQGCADGLYNQVYGAGGGNSGGICSDGILSNDAGQNCADGLYQKVYGSGSVSSGGSAASYGTGSPSYSSGGSSNPMVNPNCESGGNSQVVSPDGTYWGKYQFDYSTWVAHGGSPGSYGSASEAEQDQVAARVNYDAWPNC